MPSPKIRYLHQRAVKIPYVLQLAAPPTRASAQDRQTRDMVLAQTPKGVTANGLGPGRASLNRAQTSVISAKRIASSQLQAAFVACPTPLETKVHHDCSFRFRVYI